MRLPRLQYPPRSSPSKKIFRENTWNNLLTIKNVSNSWNEISGVTPSQQSIPSPGSKDLKNTNKRFCFVSIGYCIRSGSQLWYDGYSFPLWRIKQTVIISFSFFWKDLGKLVKGGKNLRSSSTCEIPVGVVNKARNPCLFIMRWWWLLGACGKQLVFLFYLYIVD